MIEYLGIEIITNGEETIQVGIVIGHDILTITLKDGDDMEHQQLNEHGLRKVNHYNDLCNDLVKMAGMYLLLMSGN
jgi:hypothetical protein